MKRPGGFVPRSSATRPTPSVADLIARPASPATRPGPPYGRERRARRDRGPSVQMTELLATARSRASSEAFWSEWLTEQLPQDIRRCIVHIAEQAGQLTLYAGSAALAARLRYAVVEIQDAAQRLDGHQILVIRVRVMPQGGGR